MIASLRTLEKLRVNPNWAKSPLFDRKGWKKVRFGDVVENVNETCDPKEAGIERFIAMEHLKPGSLHVRKWGKVADGTTFTRRCKAEQILFGKRRAYQRKVAVAEFEGVVSGDIYVFESKKELLSPRLLPFLCMSDSFFEIAVETSAGSLSPRTNWKHLADFEFEIPPLNNQIKIAEMLWSIDGVHSAYRNTLEKITQWVEMFVEGFCFDEKFAVVQMRDVLDNVIAGKSVIGVNEPAIDGKFGVLKVSAVGPKGFDESENKRLINQKDFLPKFAVSSNDFLITRCNTTELVGRVCTVPRDFSSLMLCDKTIKLKFNKTKVIQKFAEVIFRSKRMRLQIEARATGTGGAMKNISQEDIRSLLIPCPGITKQSELIEKIESAEKLLNSIEDDANSTKALSKCISKAIFG